MAVQIQLRRDTAANWTSVNPTLAQGEVGLEIDTGKRKIGNGSSAWNSLAYDQGGLPAVAISAGTQSQSTGTVVFSNTNGVTFGLSNGTITASVAAGGGGNMTISASGSSVSNGQVVFSNSNNVSFGMNGSTITGSASYPTQTSLNYSNSNNVTFGIAGSTITASASYPAQTVQPVAFSASGGASNFSTLSFSNANGITFSNSAGQVAITHGLQYSSNTSAITANALNTSQSSLFQLTSNTSNITTGALGTGASASFVLTANSSLFQLTSNTSNITTGALGTGASASFVLTANSSLFQLTSNTSNITTGALGTGASASFVLTANSSLFQLTSNTSNITSNALNTSQSSLFVLTANDTSKAGTGTTVSLSNLTGSFVLNSNGLSVALTGNSAGGGGGGNMTISANGSSVSSGQIVFSNSNNVSFGMNGSTITASAAAGGADGVNIIQMGNSLSSTGTTFSSISGTVYLYASGANQISQNSNSIIYLDNDNWALYGNTAGTTSYSLRSQDGMYFSGAGAVTVSGNSNTIVLNVADYNLAFLGNTAGSSSAADQNGTFFFAGGNNITLSASGSTVSIVGAAGGGGGAYTRTFFEPPLYGSSTTISMGNGTVYFSPAELDLPNDVDKYIFQMSGNSSRTTASFSGSISGGSATSGTGTWGHSGTVLMFSRVNTNETNASYNSILSFDSQTYSISAGYSASVSWSTNASSATATVTTSAALGFVQNIDGAGGRTYSSTTSSGSTTFSSTSTNANTFSTTFNLSFPYQYMSGIRPLFVPGSGTNINTGEYWLGHMVSTNTGSTNMGLQQVAIGNNQPNLIYFAGWNTNNSYLEIGQSQNLSTSNWRLGYGSYSSSGNTSTQIALTQISQMQSNASMYFVIDGNTK